MTKLIAVIAKLAAKLGRSVAPLAAVMAVLLNPTTALAEATYIHGYISNVTFADDEVMIMVSAGLPDNCVGSAWGWMKIPVANKAMIAFVIGLWLRGDASSTFVTVYTEGLVDGYCRIRQIDPEN